ncbi:MAG: hypothetical protein AUI53_04625 [Acidobacteria bacterium 13_1_40CM_2_60_7]|nr:MAG: hypothetical protein AUI53_04625 [Acidobacteria bacterium 13_1_40CM_2_60_7]
MNPMAFMPEHAPLAVLTFLGTIGLLGLAAVVFLFAALLKRKWIALGTAAVALLIAVAYALVLVGVSLTSHQLVLAPGERKYFCEIDCHIAYSVAGVEEAHTLGDESHPASATGRFVIIHLKTWFDSDTISPHRGNGPLAPGTRRVVLVDDRGREFAPSANGQAALVQMRGATPPLTQPLPPGESYVTDFVFDAPADARNLRLFVADDFPLDHFLIGHELSPLHPRIYLALARPVENHTTELRGGNLSLHAAD